MHFNETKNVFFAFVGFLSDFLCIVFWILIIFGFDEPYVATLSVVCAVIHEMGHEICFLKFYGRASMPSGRLCGLKIRATRLLSYRKEIITYAAGPIANLCAAAVSFAASFFIGEYALTFAFLNLAVALSNLLPVKGQDGYGIISSVICSLTPDGRAMRVLEGTSLLFSAVLCFFSLYLMKNVGEGFWIFALFYVSTLSSLIYRPDNNL